MDKERIKELIDEAISENPKLFLVDWSVSNDFSIEVLVDGDDGLPIEEIVRISRHIEHNLDREAQDFSLNVSSPGLGNPLTLPRQFMKNMGRTLKILTNDNQELEGELINVDDESVKITWKAKEPKPVGKGKQMVIHEQKINYNDIKKAIVKITF